MRRFLKYFIILSCIFFTSAAKAQTGQFTSDCSGDENTGLGIHYKFLRPTDTLSISFFNYELLPAVSSDYQAIKFEQIDISPSCTVHSTFISPDYVQGKFCDFEDWMNRKNKLRINFGSE